MQGYSCAELKEQGLTKSGIYYLLIRDTTFWYIKNYCDMETANGGWTVSVQTEILLIERETGRPFMAGRMNEQQRAATGSSVQFKDKTRLECET